jgi:DNA-binding transcriptional ArsR family regulator
MSASSRSGTVSASKLRDQAPVFAALGDATRLSLVARLSSGSSLSITELTSGAGVTRQAITKHLRVLEDAGLVRGKRRGRESLYQLSPEPLKEARRALSTLSEQWDQALARLKAFVEE